MLRNISACKTLAEVTRSSFGPNGLNKLVVNNLEKLFLTSDAGTILREVDVEHPAARLLWMASQQQEKEMGDGTNLVVLLAGEMLNGAEELLRMGIKPAQIVEGFELAYRRALDVLEGEQVEMKRIALDDDEAVLQVLRSVIGSKQYGYETYFARLVLEALRITHVAEAATIPFEPDNVHCVKILGGALPQSTVVAGLVLEREPMGRVHSVKDAKIAVFACPINISRTETKGTVLIKGAQELLDFGKGEEAILRKQLEAIAAAGVNVVVTGETIGELAMHFIERAGMMALKVPSKFDLRRLCKAVGATPLARLGAPTAEEAGYCSRVERIEFGGTRCTVLCQDDPTRSRLATIVLRSNTQSLLDDVERAMGDALATLRVLSKTQGRICAGAGATEMEIARLLLLQGETTPGVAQYAIRKYAEAFEVVPRTLAANAGHDSTEAIAKLSWAHQQHPAAGIDIETGEVVERMETVQDLLAAKQSAVHLATEAALTVLRVDQIIMSKPANGPKPRPAGPQDADD